MSRKNGCALLAGGAGSRMGNINKAELKYQGMTFSEKAAAELAETGMPCYLSVANYEQTVPEGWKLVKDRVRGEDGGYIGPMGGIFSCLAEAAEDGLDGLFFMPCDAPEFSSEIIKALKSYTDGHDVILWKTSDGKPQTTFGYYSVNCIPQFRKDISEGKYKLIKTLESLDTLIISAADAGIDDRHFRNINHMYEYRSLNGAGITGKGLATLDDAVTVLADQDVRLSTESVPLQRADGRVLAEDVRAGKILICLSGNPGAALTSYLRVIQPMVRKMTGRRDIYPKTLKLRLENGVMKSNPNTRVLKGNIVVGNDGYAYFRENPRQRNGMIYGFANMGVIADVPVNDGPTPAGTIVTCRILEE